MKFSLRLNNDLPVETYVKLAQLAESFGLDQFWVSNDLFLRSAPIILTAIATATERIEIGTCILNPYTIHPAEIAMIAATLDEVSNGRFNLGLSSGAVDFLGWIGIQPERPRTAVLETVKAVRSLLAADSEAFSGQWQNWGEEAYMRFEPLRQVPIYIGAMSPRMLGSIGEIADGGLPLLFPPEHYANVITYIKVGAEQAGRSMDEIDIAACIWCSIASDRESAQDVLREKVAYYGHAMSDMILQQLGLTREDFDEIEHAVMVENDMHRAKTMITDQMLGIGIAGTVDDLILRLESLVKLGVKHLSFGPPLGPDIFEAIRLIGVHVLPHFRNGA